MIRVDRHYRASKAEAPRIGMTQAEVARLLGMSHQRVAYIERKALEKMRREWERLEDRVVWIAREVSK